MPRAAGWAATAAARQQQQPAALMVGKGGPRGVANRATWAGAALGVGCLGVLEVLLLLVVVVSLLLSAERC